MNEIDNRFFQIAQKKKFHLKAKSFTFTIHYVIKYVFRHPILHFAQNVSMIRLYMP